MAGTTYSGDLKPSKFKAGDLSLNTESGLYKPFSLLFILNFFIFLGRNMALFTFLNLLVKGGNFSGY